MPMLYCRNCGYRQNVSRELMKFGMQCPECHCTNLRPKRKENKANRVETVRARTIRALIGGGLLAFLGVILLGWGLMNWNAGRFGTRMLAYGIVLLMMGGASLLSGIVWLVQDLRT